VSVTDYTSLLYGQWTHVLCSSLANVSKSKCRHGSIEAEFQRETCCIGPYAGVGSNLTLSQSQFQKSIFHRGGSFLPGTARAAATAAPVAPAAATEGPREAASAAAGGVGETVVSP
jgi:hypothetical protein